MRWTPFLPAAALALGLALDASGGEPGSPCAAAGDVIMSGRIQDVVAGLHDEALPARPFRIHLRGGVEEFRPQPINDTNRARRRLMLALIQGVAGTSTPLHPRLRDLINRTAANRREHGAYILRDGTLGVVTVGEPGWVDLPEAPAGAVGYVHTHPTPCELLAPPSVNDAGVMDFARYPIQLVVECDRVWGVLQPQHATLLGTLLPGGGGFQPLRDGDPTAERAYYIVDGDTLRMEAFTRDECHERELRQARERAMRELSERRAAEAERRRQGSSAGPASPSPSPSP